MSKPSVVKKIPGAIINHLKCLQSHKTGIVENFHVSLHIFFQRSGRRKNFQFVLQTCNFHFRVTSLIVIEKHSAEFASLAIPSKMKN